MGRARRIEDESEETLSLIDLPITPMKPNSCHNLRSSSIAIRQEERVESENRACFKTEDDEQSSDFDFGSTRFEMSSADELFLHGQILPLRLSVDSRMSRVMNPGRPEWMSESRSSSVEFTSSRSSSYSSSTSSVNGTNVVRTTTYQPKIRNQFHAHPSPTPRLRGTAQSNVTKISSSRCRKSSVWDVFRLGPVQPPGIELKDLKTRNSGNPKHNVKTQSFKGRTDKQIDRNLTTKTTLKQRMFGLVNVGCICTADAVENTQTRIVVLKSGDRRRSDFKEGEFDEELKVRIEEDQRRRGEQREDAAAAEVLPGRRTFEWLKKLSVDGDVK